MSFTFFMKVIMEKCIRIAKNAVLVVNFINLHSCHAHGKFGTTFVATED